MKRISLIVASVVAAFAVNAHAEKLSVGATAVPHAEILEFVKPKLAKEGVELGRAASWSVTSRSARVMLR